ncbi:CidA/LrgA family protein [Acinetobacter qingfengensis]|nr:CidA/LrgA family protein [Acinetobacter qingfengensis]
MMIWYLLDQLLQSLQLTMSASVLGLFLLLLSLKNNLLPVSYVQDGGHFLLKNMLLFFIPPVVGLVQYTDILLENGIKIFTAIFLGTLIVMYSSKITVHFLMK